MKRKKENKQAVSLIVLVITIIVMAILAGAIILTLNNSGIIQRASEAVDVTNLATVKEVAQLKWAEAYANGLREQEDLEEYVLDGLTQTGIKTEDYIITVTITGVEVALKGETPTPTPIPTDWEASVEAIVDTVPIPKGFAVSPYGADEANNIKAENTKAGGLVIYELTEDEIANGATALPSNETQFTSWTTRNQYVWVPVDTATFDTTFVRNGFGMDYTTLSITLGSSDYWEVLPTTELSTNNLKYMTEDTLTEVQAMYASVRKYGGFYIARYESGIDTQRTAQGTAANLPGIKEGTKVYSVMGKIPYTYIPWTWNNVMNEDANGAIEVSRRMYPESNTNYGVISTLTYAVQWDRTLQWFIDTGTMTLNQVNSAEGSTAFGNYKDHEIAKNDLNEDALVSVYNTTKPGSDPLGSYVSKDSNTLTYPKASGTMWALSTGALKAANINNIYDMAGNVIEWTMEGSSNILHAGRGGCFYSSSGSTNPVAHRNLGNANYTSASNDFGFRMSLYIK